MTPTTNTTEAKPDFPHQSLAARKTNGYWRVTVHLDGSLKRVIPADSTKEADWLARQLRAANKGTTGIKVAVHHQPGTGDVAYRTRSPK